MTASLMDGVQWTAAITGMAAASHISARVTGVAFIIFTVSSVLWIAFAASEDQGGLLIQNLALTLINLIGVYRYLIRRKKV